MQLLVHLFFPRHTNNFRAKILHPSWLLFITALLLLFYVAHVPSKISRILGYTATQLPVKKIVELTNNERQKAGLPPLKFDSALAQAAKAKGDDMLVHDYWAHISPLGITPWSFFNVVGYVYRYAGENLARDFDNPKGIVDAWMASSTHRDNLLSAKYEDIGIAVVEGELNGAPTTLVVQLFGKRMGDSAIAQVQQIVAGPSPTPTVKTLEPQVVVSQSVRDQISPFMVKRTISLGLVGLFLIILIIDGFVMIERRLVRVSGRTLAHFGFFVSVGITLFIIQRGIVL